MPAPGSRAGYAQRYGARGLPIFPLHWIVRDVGGVARCSCSDPDCRSPGKHPLTPNGVKDASADSIVLRNSWDRWPEANIGLAMGSVSGMFAVDVDPRNGGDATIEELQARHGRLPDTVNALTGGGGQHLLFKFDPARRLPGKLGAGVDVKGEGGYIVVEPSDHVSGLAYAWEADGDPLDGVRAADAPGWIFETVATVAAAPTTVGAVGFIPPSQYLELRSALACLPCEEYSDWIPVLMALKSTGAPNAIALAIEWSQLSEKYDAAKFRKTWATLEPNKIHVESIFAKAATFGWVNPASNIAGRYTEEQKRAVAAMNGTDVLQILPEARTDVRPFPTRLLQDTQQWVSRQVPTSHPLIDQQIVLTIVATATSRMYVNDDGDSAHLYLGIVSDTIEYSRYAGDLVKRVMTESGLRRLIRGARLGTAASVYSTLVKSPACVHVCDEWGHLIAFAKRQPSGAIDQAMNLLTSIYSMPVIHLDSAAEAGIKAAALDDQLVIYQPSLSLLALMSSDQMAPLMRRGELGKGALLQMLSVFVEAGELVERKADAGPVPQWLVDRITTARRLPTKGNGEYSLQDVFGMNAGLKPQYIRVRCRLDLDEALAPLDEIGTDIKTRPFLLAARKTARRIATGLAAFDNPNQPEITPDILDWTVHYVRTAITAWFNRFQTMSSDEGKVSVMQQVLEIIERSKTAGVLQRDILSSCWAFRNLPKEKREELIGTLLGDEGVVQVDTKSGRSKVFVSSRFAKRLNAEDSQQTLSAHEGSNPMKNVLNFSKR